MRKVIIITFILFSLFQIYVRDFYVDYYEKTSGAEPDIFYLPDSKYIKPFVFGYDSLAADLIWIKTISYFADQFLGAKNYRYLEKLLYIITGLDPMFDIVYIWGGSALMYNGNWINKGSVMQSTRFLKYGWNTIKNQRLVYRHDPDYWRIPHMIGFNYAIELRDVKRGIPYIEEVAKIKEAPTFYKTWLSTLYRKGGDQKMAAKSLEKELIAENLRAVLKRNINDRLKREIISRLTAYYRELYDEDYAKKRIAKILGEVAMLNGVYARNYKYMPLELFLILNSRNVVEPGENMILDRLFYE